MTYTKNIMMVLIAVFMVIAFAMPVMATDGNETFDSSVVTEDIVTPEITPEPTQTPEGVWHNDNYYTYEDYLKMVNGANVVYNSKTGVASKIRDTTPVVPDYSKQGNVVFIVRAGGSAQDLNVWVKDVTNTTIPAFDYTYNPDKSMIDGQNIGYERYTVYMDGQSDLLPFPAGKYVAYMQNGNGGQPEVQEFIVGNGDTTRVAFLGHAVSSVAKSATTEPAGCPEITKRYISTGGIDKVKFTLKNNADVPQWTHIKFKVNYEGKSLFGRHWNEHTTTWTWWYYAPVGSSNHYSIIPYHHFFHRDSSLTEIEVLECEGDICQPRDYVET